MKGHEIPNLKSLLKDENYNPNKKVKMKMVKEYFKELEKQYSLDIETTNLKLNDMKKKYDEMVKQQKEIQKETDLENFIHNSLAAFSNKIIRTNSASIREELVNKVKEYAEMKVQLKEAHELLVEMEDKYDKSLLESKNKIDKYDKERFQLIETIGRKDAEINTLKEENKKYAEAIKLAQESISELNNQINNLIFIPKEEIEEYVELTKKIINESK